MSHDGCKEVEWKGQAFPYLLHHPNSFLNTENYGSQRNASNSTAPSGHASGSSGSDTMQAAGTGTWNGPAPRGMRGGNQATATAGSPPVKEPDTVLLSTGARLPLIGVGTYLVDSPDLFMKALELGYRHFDCAACYGNEEVVGEGLREFIAAGRREELFLTSKVWNDSHHPQKVRESCEKSLAALGCQYLDLYLIHWPEAFLPGSDINGTVNFDTSVTIAETWSAMESLVDAGLVRAIGVSNFNLTQVEELLGSCRIKPAVNQVELHPQLAQRKLTGVCLRKGVQCVAYAPLGSHKSGALLDHPTVLKVAEGRGKTPAQVLLRWNVQRGVPVITKTSSPVRLASNIEGLFEWSLSYEEKAELDRLDEGKHYIDYTWHDWGSVEDGGVAKPSLVM